ncbi:hypothetical protein BT93_I0939 [Corymbia citriodora subsp. variegata]|nr:hypothetical protein BT93_I0939 [Corymbia citriodora subsp. variegata]
MFACNRHPWWRRRRRGGGVVVGYRNGERVGMVGLERQRRSRGWNLRAQFAVSERSWRASHVCPAVQASTAVHSEPETLQSHPRFPFGGPKILLSCCFAILYIYFI